MFSRMFSRILQTIATSSLKTVFIKNFPLMFGDLFYQEIKFDRGHTLRRTRLIRMALNCFEVFISLKTYDKPPNSLRGLERLDRSIVPAVFYVTSCSSARL